MELAPVRPAVPGMAGCRRCRDRVRFCKFEKLAEKDAVNELKSSCCGAAVRVAGGTDGTHWHECEKCGQPCDINFEKDFFEIERRLIFAAALTPPAAFKARLSAMVANVIGNLPDDYWRQFIKLEPCGRPGCACHLGVQKQGVELFKLLRQEHQEHAEVMFGGA